ADHAILVGYGRVGSVIGESLQAAGVAHAVIERSPRVAEKFLLPRGVPSVVGDASVPGILGEAGIAHARLLVIASPDSYYVRRVLELAREARPDIRAVVRTHHSTEVDRLLAMGATHAVMGEHELALAMTRYSLQELER
ncbi:sodium:proton antiporter, partial [bacterium]